MAKMKRKFVIEVGFNEKDTYYAANIFSVCDNKATSVSSHTLKGLMPQITKLVRKREMMNRNFPLPEPSRIISIEQTMPSIILPNGR